MQAAAPMLPPAQPAREAQPPLLTEPWAETLRHLIALGYSAGRAFQPFDPFPLQDVYDRGHRVRLAELAAAGLLGCRIDGGGTVYTLTCRAVWAWDGWRQARYAEGGGER